MGSRDPAKDQPSVWVPGARTVLTLPLPDRLVIGGGMPALGLLLAVLLPPFARWVTGLEVVVPMRIAFVFVGAIDRPWEVALLLATGLVLGLGVAYVAVIGSTKVTLTDAELRLDTGDRTQTIARADVDAVFLDGKNLIVLDGESRQLARDAPGAPGGALAAAFRAHRYPWRDTDPYADLYRRWVHGTPELPPAVNAALRPGSLR
jgi:hypothetical protein